MDRELFQQLSRAISKQDFQYFFELSDRVDLSTVLTVLPDSPSLLMLARQNRIFFVSLCNILLEKNLASTELLLKEAFAILEKENFCILFPWIAFSEKRRTLVALGHAFAAQQKKFLDNIVPYSLLSLQAEILSEETSAKFDSAPPTRQAALEFSKCVTRYNEGVETLKEIISSDHQNFFGNIESADERAAFLLTIESLLTSAWEKFPFPTKIAEVKNFRVSFQTALEKVEAAFLPQKHTLVLLTQKREASWEVDIQPFSHRLSVLSDCLAALQVSSLPISIGRWLSTMGEETFFPIFDKRLLEICVHQFFLQEWLPLEIRAAQHAKICREDTVLHFQATLIRSDAAIEVIKQQYQHGLDTGERVPLLQADRMSLVQSFLENYRVPLQHALFPFCYAGNQFRFVGFPQTPERATFDSDMGAFLKAEIDLFSTHFSAMTTENRAAQLCTIENRLQAIKQEMEMHASSEEVFVAEKTALIEKEKACVTLLTTGFVSFNAFATFSTTTEKHCLKGLLQRIGIVPASRNAAGDTFLHWLFKQTAPKSVHGALCQLLLEMGWSLGAPENQDKLVPFDLIVQDPTPTESNTVLLDVCKQFLAKEVALLIATRALQEEKNDDKIEDLFSAVRENDFDTLAAIFRKNPMAIQRQKEDDFTLLHQAVQKSIVSKKEEFLPSLKMISFLLAHGADIEAKTADHMTVDIFAKQEPLVSHLLDFYRAEKDFFKDIDDGRADLIEVALPKRHQALQTLKKMAETQSPLVKSWVVDFVTAKKKQYGDHQGNTPLHHYLKKLDTASPEEYHFVLSLIQKWFYGYPHTIYVKNNDGIMPLHAIIHSRHNISPLFFSWLCYAIAQKNIASNDVLHVSAYLQSVTTDFLNRMEEKSQTLLHVAAQYGSIALFDLLLQKGLNPLLIKTLGKPLNVFQLLANRNDLEKMRSLQKMRLQQCQQRLRDGLPQLKSWIFVQAKAKIFKTLNFSDFYFSSQWLDKLTSTLLSESYITTLLLPGAFVFDNATTSLFEKFIKKDTTLHKLDLRYTSLSDAVLSKLMPLMRAHTALQKIYMDFNRITEKSISLLLPVKTASKQFVSIKGNVALSWPVQMRLSKSYSPPFFQASLDVKALFQQLAALLEKHPLFQANNPMHPDAVLREIFQAIHALSQSSIHNDVFLLTERLTQSGAFTEQNGFLWPIYRLSLYALRLWQHPIYIQRRDAATQQFVNAFTQVMAQIDSIDPRWETEIQRKFKLSRKRDAQPLFYEWILQGFPLMKKGETVGSFIPEQMRVIFAALSLTQSQAWFEKIKPFYQNKNRYLQQNEVLAHVLASYFSEQLCFLDSRSDVQQLSSIEQLALLLAAICLYALCLRQENDWIVKTLAAIRYFTWPYDMPLKTTAGTTVMASHCCQRAGLLVPSLEGLHLVGTEFKTTDCTSDVLHYGAVPLLPIETVAFEQCIHLSTDQGPEPPDYFPHHVAIKQAIARQGILPLVFDVAQIARRFWPPEALAEIQQLTQTNGSLSLATRNHLSIIKQQENDLSSLQQTVSTQEEMLRKEEGVNQESKTVIATQKETIAEQQKVISKHKETIATQEETIATQEGTIATQEEIMSEQIKTIAEQEQVIAEQKQKNALLLHTIEEKEQTSQREIEQLRAENAKLNHQLGKARRDDNNNNSGLSTGLGLFAVPPSTVADEAEDSSSEEETTVKKPSPQDGRES